MSVDVECTLCGERGVGPVCERCRVARADALLELCNVLERVETFPRRVLHAGEAQLWAVARMRLRELRWGLEATR